MSIARIAESSKRLITRTSIGMSRFGYSLPAPSEGYLMTAASEITGLDDWGEDFPREALHRLFWSLRKEAQLSLRGRIWVQGSLVVRLINWLLIRRTLLQDPGLLERPIPSPLMVTGMPRSGTTLLHRLMALDPANRSLLFWESWRPCQIPGTEALEIDPRVSLARSELDWLYARVPQMKSIHYETAESPSECIGLLTNSLLSRSFSFFGTIPSYITWLEKQDMTLAYRLYRSQLQILQSRSMEARWLLKAPVHRNHLPVIDELFPDTVVVFSHRDPAKVVPSMANLRAATRGIYSNRVDPAKLGRELLANFSRRTRKSLRGRAACNSLKFHEVFYRDLMADPIGTVREIYEIAGREFTGLFEQHMRRYLAENPKNKFGVHKYSLKDFGLERKEIEREFAFYYDRYGEKLIEADD